MQHHDCSVTMIEAEAREHAYLVARGVRPLGIVGHCDGSPETIREVECQLTEAGNAGAIPFVVSRGDGIADYGYARSRWAIDLLRWAESDAVPTEHRHRVIGLLLGYSVEAIRAHEERDDGGLIALTPHMDG